MAADVAFDKAANLFGFKLVKIPLDSNYRMDLKLLKKATNSNTVCIIGSFPSHPYGICDDIELIATIAKKAGVPVHVDAGIGGFLASFYSYSHIKFPRFDFLVDGIVLIYLKRCIFYLR